MFSSGGEWISFGIGLYGALVATAVAAYQFVRDRPGVKLIVVPVNVTYGMLVGSYDGSLHLSAKPRTSGPSESSITASALSRSETAVYLGRKAS